MKISGRLFKLVALLVVLGTALYFAVGLIWPKTVIPVILTVNMEGSLLNLPCNRLGPKRHLYTITSNLEAVSALRGQMKKKGLDALYLDGGNTIAGVDDFASFRGGVPVLKLLKEAGCDVFVPGRAELKNPSFNGEMCKTPCLIPSDGGKGVVPGVIIEKNRVRIHVFSYDEPFRSVMMAGAEEKTEGIKYPSADDLNDALRSSDCPIKIVVADVGNIDLFTKKIRGAHLIIPRRFHHQLNPDGITVMNGVKVAPCVYSRCHGAALITFEKSAGNFPTGIHFSLQKPVREAPLPEILASDYRDFKKTYTDNYEKIHSSILSVGSEKLGHQLENIRETPSSMAVADMIRNYAGTDVALINLLSVRRPLAGVFRSEYLEWLLPFDNQLVTMELSGSRISAILMGNRKRKSSFIIISGGQINYTADDLSVRINGEKIDPNKYYTVATNDYLAAGEKIDYRIFRTGRNIRHTGIPIGAIVLKYILHAGYILPPPDRIGPVTLTEVESLNNPEEKIKTAYGWGFFSLLTLRDNAAENEKIRKLKDAALLQAALYCGLIGKDEFAENLGKDENLVPPEDRAAFMGMIRFRQGRVAEAFGIWREAGAKFPKNGDLVRLAGFSDKNAAPVRPMPPLWPAFKFNRERTGLCPYEGPSKKPKVLWKFATGHSNKSSPAIGHGEVVYFGGGDGYFYAVDKSGAEKWKFQTGGYILSSPAIGPDGVIYVGSASKSGSSRRKTFQGRGEEDEPSSFGYLMAFNPDGSLKWRFETGGWVASSPVVDTDGSIVAGCNDHHLYRINSDGTLRWKFRTGNRILSSPAIGKDGVIYFGGEDSYFYAVNSAGKLINRHKASNKFFSSPAIDGKGRVYMGNDDSHLFCFDKAGRFLWKKRFPAPITSTVSFGSDGDMYVGCENGVLYRMRGKDRIIWTFSGDDEFFSSPIIDSKGRIYIGCEDNHLYCVSDKGALLWKFETGDYVESTVAISPGGVVYLTAEDKFLYSIVQGEK